MKTGRITLGSALAHLHFIKHNNLTEPLPDLPHEIADRVNELELKNENSVKKNKDVILSGLPKQNCAVENSFLENNDDYFLAYLLNQTEERTSVQCAQLTGHLNGCFNCFLYFNDVIRDYSHTHSSLENKANGGAYDE